ncbi:hypothetical protein HAX54_001425 [Datura stramonium]|uniref:Uncharacterized protein n=1 Tax=Datura stramonium TaxID=4076 RepID=A0ABS8T3U0_DATST|nr:hypothetical protein [Datura stramonium]
MRGGEESAAREALRHKSLGKVIMCDIDQEEQVCIILYSDDIGRCHKMFQLFDTYLISTLKIREPRGYSIRVNRFEWVVDRFIIVELVPKKNGKEPALPSPTKMNTLSFAAVEQQHPSVEFALVSNCGAMQYTANQSKRFREAIVMDTRSKDNELMLMDYTLKASSASPSSLNLTPIDDEIVIISSITSLSPMVSS